LCVVSEILHAAYFLYKLLNRHTYAAICRCGVLEIRMCTMVILLGK
jgi:hypothetical protein